ncbi:transcriptional regulator FtrA [Pseudomonas putida]|jgi:AraC family transcriptional regulator, transcriptional activator FtrA|uniref:Transcriptional regulator FtrA n=1 Tax=Pseudomonas putida TaxID=303 RepID=A0A7W2L3Z3_PSEPU|nr:MULTISPECIES: transcriptional regulator FtrA [Pseudomonas]MBA6118038.1 transcriptional regulator FtrA [Pseudomonas putida]MBI6943805.1 transcriptional regulator FtrA [Pseudomonas putida]MBI6959891.1 transcriptional regulator FtrA [Pseudomonas putida]MCZ9637684.1 transcriptional regulator FtrA [Pseudomonas putida]MEC4876683.1 transcriptional regulator FtrA [Pseudomonas sp. NC26]
MRNHLVVALIYNQLCTFEFGCTVEVFALQRAELGVPWYDFGTHAVDDGPIAAAGGITITPSASADLLERADTIIVPGWRGVESAVPDSLIQDLRAAHARGARLCSICTGAFVLAAAGLLDGHKVTTHWRFADLLASRYPQLTVLPNELYVDEGSLVTAAGSAAGLDMMLHLVRKDHGSRVANMVAQRMVVPPHREGGQSQYATRQLVSSSDAPISRVMEWVRNDLQRRITVKDMADKAGVSTRTLHRSFMHSTGLTPCDWLLGERVAYARELLESPKIRLTEVVEKSGFGSEESFRRHFRNLVGVNPTRYRRQFVQRL